MNETSEILILGPTASGKTGLAVGLARVLGGEILSVDSRQVYRRMDLGSGKDLATYGAVPCHLIDILDPGQDFSLYQFLFACQKTLADLHQRRVKPILAGGTGLYLDALLQGYALTQVDENLALRQSLASQTNDELILQLATLRPLHNSTDTQDRPRLLRALEIELGSRQGGPTVQVKLNAQVIGLRLDNEALRLRIVKRLKQRLEEGLVEEVRALLASGVSDTWLEGIGLEYRFLVRYIRGELNYNDMQQKLASEIYRFARQQMKWFRRMERNAVPIHWLDAEREPLEKALEWIEQRNE
ncbi:MAG: tRNA (adenosine(37)-N6)-dimethylallyltransferase MiaA [Hahellaceae bacterium]|nr:tRNA (adenosine(37)-N6)-dimethylallyltransferase MiaA [Hahellaceae bacterium]